MKTSAKSKLFITFTESWNGVSAYIKGRTRWPTKPSYRRLAIHIHDKVIKTNEYVSTINYNSCFHKTKKQTQRLPNGKFASIKRAVLCADPNCPRRLACKVTPISRDDNGAKSIAIAGFTKMITYDDETLPPLQSKQVSIRRCLLMVLLLTCRYLDTTYRPTSAHTSLVTV
ncbi:hypothetical protein MAM1_0067c04036 [Mucor ambiguus]|uniref:Uncharacterized protein n=1 Tax=Mucor ambiguus TaxID=91626 RepID=A0A0C9LU83_9FUNG|nr:hypothetical protein MAM1_0067c04036 [Mucor ambiguus]